MEYTQEQQAAINATESKVMVIACAAAGKSAVIVGHIKKLIERGVDPSKIVAITFTNNAAEVIKERVGADRVRGMYIGTVHGYCAYLLRLAGVKIDNLLKDENFDGLFKLFKAHPEARREIDYLIADEQQDSDTLQIEFMLDMLKPKNYYFCLDPRQQIYSFTGSRADFFLDLAKAPDVKVYHLSYNFRNGFEILNFATKFLEPLPEGFHDISIPMVDEPGEVFRMKYNEQDLVSLLYTDRFGDWFVLCRTNMQLNQVAILLRKYDIPFVSFKQGEVNNAQIAEALHSNQVKLLTIHSAKGLTVPNAIVIGGCVYNDEERRISYVAATRPQKRLIWMTAPRKPRRPRRRNADVNMISFE